MSILAKTIRGITVPPVLVTVLFLILSQTRQDIFTNKSDIILSILLLGFVPVLAYPLQRILPNYKEKGREGSRNLAFIFSIIGYTLAFLQGLLFGTSAFLQLIYNTYFSSVLLLLLMNKVFHIRASGHACCITGPLIFLVFFLNWWMLIPYVIIGVISFWASIYLHRHTHKELLFGTLMCIIAFTLSYYIMTII